MERVRDPEAVERELSAIAGDLRSQTDLDYLDRLRGSYEALTWGLGRLASAPASRRLIERPSPVDLFHEGMWADEIVRGVRPLPHGVTQAFAGGVAGGLMWMLHRTSDSPSPTSVAGLRPGTEIIDELGAARKALAAAPGAWLAEDHEEQRGVVHGLAWVAGLSPTSPVTAKPGLAGVAAIEVELNKAQQMSHISAASGPASRDFVGGVYDALAWALQRTDRRPGV